MSSSVEARARALDEARRNRMVRAEEIDIETYAKAYDVTHKVKEAHEWLDLMKTELLQPMREQGVPMPWPKTAASFRFRPGEVTVYAGSNGGGKSLLTGQIALGLIRKREPVCIASFEMTPQRTLYRMLRQFAGEDIDAPRFSDRADYLTRLIQRFDLWSATKLFLYDQQGTTGSSQVIAMARYCALELGIRHVFIDSLMKCVSGEDDYNAQKSLVDELTAVARDHQIHIHLVHHIRKLQSEEVQPSKTDLKGSGAITDLVDNVLIVWRNKKKEHSQSKNSDDPDTMLMCEKQRNGEAEDWFGLWYDRASQQFVEAPGAVPMAFDERGAF